MNAPHTHQVGTFNAVNTTCDTKGSIRISVYVVVDMKCNPAGVANMNGAGVVWMVDVIIPHSSCFLNTDRSLVHVVIISLLRR
jgi:hypothetical protein